MGGNYIPGDHQSKTKHSHYCLCPREIRTRNASFHFALLFIFPDGTGGSWVRHTEDSPCCSPAAIVSLRPVTLRPCFSTSLPSGIRILKKRQRVKTRGNKRSFILISGNQSKCQSDRQPCIGRHQTDYSNKFSVLYRFQGKQATSSISHGKCYRQNAPLEYKIQ